MGLSKRALVCGAGGFIGSHLVTFLKQQGYWVRGVDQKYPEFSASTADEFLMLDLREPAAAQACFAEVGNFDEVYQLAADMGGMGFIHNFPADILYNSCMINLNMIRAASDHKIGRYFFSSSACVYRDMEIGEAALTEEQALPALPDNDYGWEKLFSERTLIAHARKFGFEPRIARFQNCYGEEGTWFGGREKAPAAICRKVAEAEDGGSIEVWGDGTAVRSYTHVQDMVKGIFLLMQSNIQTAVNIGSPEYVSVNELVATVAEVAGKKLSIAHVDGPVGVRSRNFSNELIYSLGWTAELSLRDGIERLYPWIETQVQAGQLAGPERDMKRMTHNQLTTLKEENEALKQTIRRLREELTCLLGVRPTL